MPCTNDQAHAAHTYTVGTGPFTTTRRCEGVEKIEHFCGDRKPHKRHDSPVGNAYCPGISRAQIQSEGIELRKRFRQYGILIPLRLIIRERQWFLHIITVLDQQQQLVAQAADLFKDEAVEHAEIVANKGL